MYWKRLDRNLKVRLVGEGLFNICYWMYFPFIALYFSMTLGSEVAGAFMMLPPLVSMIGNLASGNLADHFGRRPILIGGAAIQTVMFVFFACSFSPWLDYAAFIGIALGSALYRAPSLAMVADVVPEEERRDVFALFATTNNMGAVVGPVMGAFLFFQFRQILLWTTASVLLLYLLCLILFVNETKPTSTHEKQVSVIAGVKHACVAYRHILGDRVFARFIIAGVFSVMTIMQLDLYLAYYIVTEIPDQRFLFFELGSMLLTGETILGWMLALNGLLFVMLVFPLANWTKRWKERDLFVFSCLLSGIGMFALGFVSTIWSLLLLTVVFTVGELLRAPISDSFVSRYAPMESRAMYIGASNLQYTVGRMLAPLTILFATWVAPLGIFFFMLVCSLASAALYTNLFRMISQNKEKHERGS
ncbi:MULTISPECIES: MDR family MFS transporter [Shouchella]|uniref:Major facilitator (MFS) superfamily protein n=1 Tax=Shouchella clausii (strain KSM-K16) TaxID=66692 RepID=Q5WCE4_SHOC1|nr:MFS transporter [Shouchella clausii]KKI86221.1 MFS transporter [Shouchella clausii]MCM3314915.1 MFS transporter [Psychrobacillus sp. MER TA 17]MCM3378536.1 MFS transporter [Shouchella rhizosphaerae]BAD65966.1 major facilitator (MFS) superfamily protein [Shouchella clausii KSM-K16]